jgi:hypothetical protein
MDRHQQSDCGKESFPEGHNWNRVYISFRA